ncbi:nucleolar protein 12 [Scheffersomyces coipomensis]|uniref:nucleolar protein 12 n=1 Tax=Scheffersomyces coipomensis TaxID=1788519 RepID=UPI00315D45E2
MSSFSSLFGGNKGDSYDSAVDSLFKKSSDGPVSRNQLKSDRTVIEIPQREPIEEDDDDEEVDDDEENDDEDEEEEIEEPVAKKSKKKKDAHDDLEHQYYAKLLKEDEPKSEEKEEKEDKEDEEEDNSGSDDDNDSTEETSTKETKGRAAKTIDLKETELEKAERTIFVGNLTANVINSKPIAKKLKQLFSEVGKIDSVRYRSIAFEENLPRKIAIAKRNLHKSRDTLNAYIVYKEKPSSLKAVTRFNGTIFEHFHLRVDHIAHPSPKDNKRTIFVGNLDFEEKEETLWRYFNSKLNNDVESVRVIRDSKTNVGKGFALVQFNDTLSVNKALLLHDKPIENYQDSTNSDSKKKKLGRKLRISRANSKVKPSTLSPNHIDNVKKSYASSKSRFSNNNVNLTEQQKVKLGRGKSILGKADKSTIGQAKRQIIEGHRASKGQPIVGIKGLKTGKVKKPRLRDRSTKFKAERKQMQTEVATPNNRGSDRK